MLKSPRAGVKNATIEKILLPVAQMAHKMTKKCALNGKYPLSIFTDLTCLLMHVVKLQVMDRPSQTWDDQPKKVTSFSNNVFNPPVVGVKVSESKRRRVCPAT